MAYYSGGGMPKFKKFGLFDEELPPATKPTGMLNDPETSARMQALYPMKSEFNDAWVQGREADEPQPLRTENRTLLDALPAPEARTDEPQVPLPNPETPIMRAERNYENAVTRPVEKQSPAKQALFMALQAIGNIATGQNKPIEWLGNARKRYEIEQEGQTLGALQNQEQIRQQRDLRDAQIRTIPIDDELRRQQIENNRVLGEERIRNSALNKVNSLKVYDPKNAAARRLAEQAGLDPDSMGGWDFRNPIEHSINGVRFRLNRQTGKYEQTDLPVDEEKQLVDFKTKDGKTYRVSAKTAASLQTQFDTLGIRQEFQAQQNQLNREQQIRLQEIGQQQKIQLEALKTANELIKMAKTAEEKRAAEERKQQAQQTYEDLRNERIRLQNQKTQQDLVQ